MPALRRSTILTLCVLLAGCATVNTVKLGPERFAPVDPESVRFFATVAPRSYVEVAVLAGVSDPFVSEARLAEKMKREAARLGANGILLINLRPGYGAAVGTVNADSSVVMAAGGGATFGRAIAIRYDPSVAAAESAAAGAPPRAPW